MLTIMSGPFEVESTLKLHPAVIESAVVASPDSKRSEVVKAFIVLTSEYSQKTKFEAEKEALTKEIQDFCKENASPYKYPRKVQFVDASFLPKMISGKIKRAELKKMEWRKEGERNCRFERWYWNSIAAYLAGSMFSIRSMWWGRMVRIDGKKALAKEQTNVAANTSLLATVRFQNGCSTPRVLLIGSKSDRRLRDPWETPGK